MADLDAAQSLTLLTLRCRSKSGNWVDLDVRDISLAGCLVDRRAWSSRPGDRVLVQLPGLSFQPAQVVWVEGEQAGIAFEELLYEPVLEHLRQSAA